MYSALTLILDHDGGDIEAAALNLTRLQALQMVQRFALQLVGEMEEAAPPEPQEDEG